MTLKHDPHEYIYVRGKFIKNHDNANILVRFVGMAERYIASMLQPYSNGLEKNMFYEAVIKKMEKDGVPDRRYVVSTALASLEEKKLIVQGRKNYMLIRKGAPLDDDSIYT